MKKPKPQKRPPRQPANSTKSKQDKAKSGERYHLDSVLKRPDME